VDVRKISGKKEEADGSEFSNKPDGSEFSNKPDGSVIISTNKEITEAAILDLLGMSKQNVSLKIIIH
jgi:hypothetical protein